MFDRTDKPRRRLFGDTSTDSFLNAQNERESTSLFGGPKKESSIFGPKDDAAPNYKGGYHNASYSTDLFDQNQTGYEIIIEKMVIRVLPPPPKQYMRPNMVSNFNGRSLNHVVDKTIEALSFTGGRASLTPSAFSGITGGFMRPSQSPTALIATPDEAYAGIWLWLRTRNHSLNSKKYELVCARTDARNLLFDRMNECYGIDPDAELRINNVVLLDIVQEFNQSQGYSRERLRYNSSSEIVADANFTSYRNNSAKFLQTPDTAIYSAISNEVGGEGTTSSSSIVTTTPKPVLKAMANPGVFFSHMTNSLVQAENMSEALEINNRGYGFPGDDEDDEAHQKSLNLSNAARMSQNNVFNSRFALKSAIERLTNAIATGENSGLFGGYVTWKDLTEIDPRYVDFLAPETERNVEVFIPKKLSQNKQFRFGMSDDNDDNWGETSEVASAASMLYHLLLSCMSDLGISSCFMHVTNETSNGDFIASLKGDESLSFVYGSASHETVNQFLTRVEREIMPEVATSDDGYMHEIYAKVSIETMGHVSIDIRMDGGKPTKFTASSLMSADTTPLVTNKVSTLASIGEAFRSISDEVSDYRQASGLDSLRRRR